MAKYSVRQQPVETLLSWIKSGDIVPHHCFTI